MLECWSAGECWGSVTTRLYRAVLYEVCHWSGRLVLVCLVQDWSGLQVRRLAARQGACGLSAYLVQWKQMCGSGRGAVAPASGAERRGSV